MQLIERPKPDGRVEKWELKDISYNSENKVVLIFKRDFQYKPEEKLVCLDEKESDKLIKFIDKIKK